MDNDGTIDFDNEFFWTSGRDGVLRFLRCAECEVLVHPPVPYCAQCGGTPEPTAVSGRGTVYSFTVNHQAWDGTTDPYVISLVARESGLRKQIENLKRMVESERR